MTIKDFISRAIKGGWKHHLKSVYPAEILLDPLAWKAVGKVGGWEDCDEYGNTKSKYIKSECPRGGKSCTELAKYHWENNVEGIGANLRSGSEYRMHCMIDALCEGKSLVDFIKTL